MRAAFARFALFRAFVRAPLRAAALRCFFVSFAFRRRFGAAFRRAVFFRFRFLALLRLRNWPLRGPVLIRGGRRFRRAIGFLRVVVFFFLVALRFVGRLAAVLFFAGLARRGVFLRAVFFLVTFFLVVFFRRAPVASRVPFFTPAALRAARALIPRPISMRAVAAR